MRAQSEQSVRDQQGEQTLDPARESESKAEMRQGRAYALFACVALAVVIVDQFVKAWARTSLVQGTTLTVVPGVLGLTLVKNTGAAFGLFAGHIWAFVICAVLVIVACVLAVRFVHPRRPFLTVVLGLVCGGGIGNIIDRVLLGYVTDLFAFQFVNFPVFNVADIAITCGFALFIVFLFVGGRR